MFDQETNRRGQPLPEIPIDWRFFTAEEVGALLGWSAQRVADMCKDGSVTAVLRHRRRVIPRYEVTRLLQVFGDTSQATYTPRMAAKILEMSEKWVHKMCRAGQISTEPNVPGPIRIPESEIRRILEDWEAQGSREIPQGQRP